MVYTFNLWNLYFPSEHECEFDVTTANLPEMKDGSPEFIGASLKALAVNSSPKSWTITPFRSQYFTDYPSPENAWEDRWKLGWTIRVELQDLRPQEQPTLARLPERVDALDSTWRDDEDHSSHDATALVISVHRVSTEKMNKLAEEIVAATKSIAQMEPTTSLRSYPQDMQQLRLLFSPVSFPDWIAVGDKILDLCRDKGGMVNFRKLRLGEED